MEKLKESVNKELHEIGEKGLTAANLPTVSTLVDIKKDIAEVEAMEKGGYGMYDYGREYRHYPYDYEDYGRGRSSGGYSEGYGARRRDPRGRCMGDRMKDHIARIEDGVEMYEYGRERYRASGDESRVHEGLEKMMYAVCMFIESTMDFAETPEEKEIIRKHIEKLHRM